MKTVRQARNCQYDHIHWAFDPFNWVGILFILMVWLGLDLYMAWLLPNLTPGWTRLIAASIWLTTYVVFLMEHQWVDVKPFTVQGIYNPLMRFTGCSGGSKVNIRVVGTGWRFFFGPIEKKYRTINLQRADDINVPGIIAYSSNGLRMEVDVKAAKRQIPSHDGVIAALSNEDGAADEIYKNIISELIIDKINEITSSTGGNKLSGEALAKDPQLLTKKLDEAGAFAGDKISEIEKTFGQELEFPRITGIRVPKDVEAAIASTAVNKRIKQSVKGFVKDGVDPDMALAMAGASAGVKGVEVKHQNRKYTGLPEGMKTFVDGEGGGGR